jgi:hypothetical protein
MAVIATKKYLLVFQHESFGTQSFIERTEAAKRLPPKVKIREIEAAIL